MKKIIIVAATLCVCTALTAYADTNPATTTMETTVTTSAAPPSSSQPVKEQKPAEKKNNENKTVYESVKSGWNSFLDLLVGPATQ